MIFERTAELHRPTSSSCGARRADCARTGTHRGLRTLMAAQEDERRRGRGSSTIELGQHIVGLTLGLHNLAAAPSSPDVGVQQLRISSPSSNGVSVGCRTTCGRSARRPRSRRGAQQSCRRRSQQTGIAADSPAGIASSSCPRTSKHAVPRSRRHSRISRGTRTRDLPAWCSSAAPNPSS